MSAKVSIIIPCYNCEKFIGDTLNRLEAQTYRDFEVLCINDGSTDGTSSVLNSAKDRHTFTMRIMEKPNGGVSSARNLGLDCADGEYLFFLDADDILHPEYLERMISAADKSGADTVYCRLVRFYSEPGTYSAPENDFICKTQAQAMHDLLYRMGEFGFCCYMYKKSAVDGIGLRFDLNTAFGEDREFNWKYLCLCENAAFIDMPLYFYRINNESATRKKASWRKTELLSAVKRIESFLRDNNCPFSSEFDSYMYARAMWAVAKTFAASRDKDLFKRLIREYDVKSCMKRTKKDSARLVSIASSLYLISPMLFYYAVGMK